MSASTHLNPVDPGFIACPFPAYRSLRDVAPVRFVDHGRGFWFVTRHDLVMQVVGDSETFSSNVGSLATSQFSPELQARMRAVAAEGVPNVPTLLTADQPVHTLNRRLVARAFTPRAVAGHAPLVRATCRELIAKWDTSGAVDFVRDFAVPLPVRVIAHALAVPADRTLDFKRWSDAAVALIGSNLSDDEVLDAVATNNELSRFLLEQITERREHPGDDLLSTLVHATLADDETIDLAPETARTLGDNEIVSIVRQLLVAGNETTTNLLTQMVVILAGENDWWDRLRDRPDLIEAETEELLRLITPSAVNHRRTTRDVELAGTTIPAGADVLVVYLSANHDERVFPRPEHFDPDRTNVHEHLAFGRGIHFCVGATLARLEIRTALHKLTSAIASWDVIDRDDLEWNTSFMLRSVRRLPLHVHRREPQVGPTC